MGNYFLVFENGMPCTIGTDRYGISYNYTDKLLSIAEYHGASFTLQLINEGVLFSDGDTGFVINNLESIGMKPMSTDNETYSVVSVNNITLSLVFEKNRIKRVKLDLRYSLLSILVQSTPGGFIWDLDIIEHKTGNALTVLNTARYPYLVFMESKEKLIRLTSHFSRENGEAQRIEAIRINEKGQSTDKAPKVQKIGRQGRLKKTQAAFRFESCEE